jgi:hypothetical protein
MIGAPGESLAISRISSWRVRADALARCARDGRRAEGGMEVERTQPGGGAAGDATREGDRQRSYDDLSLLKINTICTRDINGLCKSPERVIYLCKSSFIGNVLRCKGHRSKKQLDGHCPYLSVSEGRLSDNKQDWTFQQACQRIGWLARMEIHGSMCVVLMKIGSQTLEGQGNASWAGPKREQGPSSKNLK